MSERPSSAVTCGRCGRQIGLARNFCPFCGAPLAEPPGPVANFYDQLSELQRGLAAAFSLGEMKDLAFALGVVDFASLPGETKEDKARELALRMVRENRLAQLVALCRRERPNRAWPAFGPTPEPAENPLAAQFSAGLRAQLEGRLADARQIFEGIQRIDPNYPGLAAQLMAIRQEMGRGYVDIDGRIDPYSVLHPPAGLPGLPDPARPLPTGQARRGASPLLLVGAIVVLLLLAVAVWYLLLRG